MKPRQAAAAVLQLLAIAGLCVAGVPASAAGGMDAIVPGLTARTAELSASSVHVKPWMKAGVKPSAFAPFVYASVITGLSSGVTNVYQQEGGTLALVGQLGEGGGPLAVDRHGNVWVSDVGTDLTQLVPRNVYVYAPGSTSPSRVLHPNCTVWSIAIGYDDTAYLAGPSINKTGVPAIVIKYTNGSTTGEQLPIDDGRPALPYAIDADRQGNLFVGWLGYFPAHDYRYRRCRKAGLMQGCVDELPAGGQAWKPYLPFGGAVNQIQAGPLLGRGGRMLIYVAGPAPGVAQTFQYLVTFPRGSDVPATITTFPDATTLQIQTMVFDSAGRGLWAQNTLFNSTLPYTIWKLDTSGKILLSFSIPQTSSAIFIPPDNGIAVSPAYYP